VSAKTRRRLSVIYDGQCAFCIRSVGMLKKADSFGSFEFHDFHGSETLKTTFPMIRPEDATEAMLLVTDSGAVFKGFYAFRRLTWTSLWLWIAMPLFYLPGSSFLGVRLYAWIANNRQRFGCRAESFYKN
jgi:predicted DCC family thiol-disulfide oxidoreductase YuxK